MRLSRLLVLAIAAALAAVSPAAAADADLAFIGKIPGVKTQLQRGGPTGEAIYTVTGDSAAVFDKVHAGFVSEGWTIEKFRNTGVAGVALRTIVAVKGGTRVKVLMNAAGSDSQIIVSKAPAGDASAADTAAAAGALRDVINVTRESAPPATSGTASSSARAAGPRLDITGDRTKGTYACSDTRVVVASNWNTVTLEGQCREVVVNGNWNKIRITGSVGTIETEGGWNNVTWSAASNPNAPRLVNSGQKNEISRVE